MNEKIVEATLCFLLDEDMVALAPKLKGIGIGLWNGFGGKVEAGETYRQATIRELAQESGVLAHPKDLEPVSIVDYHNPPKDGALPLWRVHTYLLRKFKGQPEETEEMGVPRWFNIKELPYKMMLPADRIILPPTFRGKKFEAEVWYGLGMKTLIKETLFTPLSKVELNRL